MNNDFSVVLLFINYTKSLKAMASDEVSKAMGDTSELAQKIQVTGVPTLVIEGERVQTLSEREIQDKINAAKK